VNIFVLDIEPKKSAIQLCNKHLLKMIIESHQMLCNCFEPHEVPYKRTHYNHPCSIWVRESLNNYNWLFNYAEALCKEYTYRYGKIHKCETALHKLKKPKLNKIGLTPFKLAMPEQYRTNNVIDSYRQYYLNEKLHFCKWPKERIPEFVLQYCKSTNLDVGEYIWK